MKLSSDFVRLTVDEAHKLQVGDVVDIANQEHDVTWSWSLWHVRVATQPFVGDAGSGYTNPWIEIRFNDGETIHSSTAQRAYFVRRVA